MRNIARINNYYNRIEAWRDWRKIAATVDPYIASLFVPPADAGWVLIDKCIANLREATKPAPAGGEQP